MSWLSENVFNPIENVGSALAHGDITGGKYQASGSDWLKSGLDIAAIGGLGLGAAGLAGAGPLGGVWGGAEAAGGLRFWGGGEAAGGGAGGFLSDLGISAS